MADFFRLIEHAFPLKQASLDNVHEKNVRHGDISALHIWPARRPLAACRAALIATPLPDPSAEAKPEGMSEEEWQKEIGRGTGHHQVPKLLIPLGHGRTFWQTHATG